MPTVNAKTPPLILAANTNALSTCSIPKSQQRKAALIYFQQGADAFLVLKVRVEGHVGQTFNAKAFAELQRKVVAGEK